jgi:hypothetical protein
MPLPDHMQGVENAVPKWDASNPTSYNYDPKNYDPADYAKFKEARREANLKRQAKAERDLQKAMKDAAKAVNDKVKEELTKAVQPGDVLTIDKPSTCFALVEWQATGESDDESDDIEGVVTGTFHRGGKITYDGQMMLTEFLDWSADESVGSWYNDQKPF